MNKSNQMGANGSMYLFCKRNKAVYSICGYKNKYIIDFKLSQRNSGTHCSGNAAIHYGVSQGPMTNILIRKELDP